MHRKKGNSRSYSTEYLQRHDRVTSFMHWILCNSFTLSHTEKWYEHTPEPVTESTEVTILLDFTINTNKKIEANQPDITIKNFEENTCFMIYVTVPADISLKEFEKLSKYKDPEIEVIKMWNLNTKAIPFVVGALGMIKKGTQNFINQVTDKPSLQEMQKIVLTTTDHILRKVLSV